LGLSLGGIMIACGYQANENASTVDDDFYNTWNTETTNTVLKCCKNDSSFNYIQDDFKKLFRQRRLLFDTLMSNLRVKGDCYVQEHFSEGSEFAVHKMTVYLNGRGQEAWVNYKGEVTVGGREFRQAEKYFEKVEDCCPFSYQEYKVHDGFIPITCETLVTLNAGNPNFKVSLRLN
jgi:hypothetical protein